MPVLDGFETTQIIRQKGMALPVYALTGQSDTGDGVSWEAKGFDGYIPKPLSEAQLRDIVNLYRRH